MPEKDRGSRLELLTRYTKNPNLQKHGLAVEAAMRYYVSFFAKASKDKREVINEETWGIAGLLHDFDYEEYPSLEDHPYKGQEILKAEGFSDELREIIMGHAPHTGTERKSQAQKTIFAVDELCGFIVAVALTRPNKKLSEVTVDSVKKKMKQKAFAAKVSRDDITQGATELGFTLEEHIGYVLQAMQGIAGELGL